MRRRRSSAVSKERERAWMYVKIFIHVFLFCCLNDDTRRCVVHYLDMQPCSPFAVGQPVHHEAFRSWQRTRAKCKFDARANRSFMTSLKLDLIEQVVRSTVFVQSNVKWVLILKKTCRAVFWTCRTKTNPLLCFSHQKDTTRGELLCFMWLGVWDWLCVS